MSTVLKIVVGSGSFVFSAFLGTLLFSVLFAPVAGALQHRGKTWAAHLSIFFPVVLGVMAGLQRAGVALRLAEQRQANRKRRSNEHKSA